MLFDDTGLISNECFNEQFSQIIIDIAVIFSCVCLDNVSAFTLDIYCPIIILVFSTLLTMAAQICFFDSVVSPVNCLVFNDRIEVTSQGTTFRFAHPALGQRTYTAKTKPITKKGRPIKLPNVILQVSFSYFIHLITSFRHSTTAFGLINIRSICTLNSKP